MFRHAAVAMLCLASAICLATDIPELAGADGCRVVNKTGKDGAKATWNGPCRDGLADGRGILEWHDRKTKLIARYEGDMKAGLMHGDGYLKLDNATEYSGGFSAGRYHGTGTLVDMRGRYDGEFADGRRDGHGKMNFAMGGRYEGQWRDGRFHGTGTALYPSGRQVTTEWVDGIRADLAPPPVRDPKHTIRSERPAPGSRLYWDRVKGGAVPFAKTYAEMSEAEKQEVHSWFPLIDDGDEPPYPLKGTKSIYKLFSDGVNLVEDKSEGILTMYVDVDAQGNPTTASVFSTPGRDIARFAMMVVLKHQFKPAICGGKPCAMKFPFSIRISYH